MIRRAAGLAAAIAGLLLPRIALAACTPEAEPNDTMPEAQVVLDAFCLAGSTEGSDQDTFLWQVDAPSQATLTLEGLPGQDGRVQLFQLFFAEDGTAVQATTLVNLTGTPTVDTPTATLQPGRYGLLVSSDTGSLIYRLTAALSPAATPPAEPPAPQAGAFSLSTTGTGSIAFPWTLDAASAAERWGITVTAPLGGATTLVLQDPAGNTVATAAIADAAGTVRLADLALAPGGYGILVLGAPAGVAVAVGAAAEGPRQASVAEEPNDDPEHAFAAAVGVPVAGRLLATVAPEDTDCLAVTIADEAAGHLFDAVARAPGRAGLALTLLGADGESVQQRSGRDTVRMSGLTLEPGRQLFCIAGLLSPDQRYDFTLLDGGTGEDDSEREPNDTLANAGTLSADGAAFGELSGEDVDVFRLPVGGESRQWLIQAAGQGLDRLTLLDGAGTVVAEARGEPTAAVLRLPDLALLAGEYVIEVAGTDGRYLLRAAPIGPAAGATEAGAGAEAEPNGDAAQAMALTWDRPVEGELGDGADVDVYRLSVAAETHVAISLAVPGALGVQGELSWGETGHLLGRLDSTPGAAETTVVSWDGLLQPGEHYLTLSAPDAAAAGYRLLAERRSVFTLPADLEPNDVWWRAAPLPADGRLVGSLGPADADWYRLPPLAAPAEIVVALGADQPLAYGYLQVVTAEPTGSWPALDVTTVAALVSDGAGQRALLPAGERLYLALQGAEGPYDAIVTLEGVAAQPAPPAPALTAALTFATGQVAAFLDEAQAVQGSLRLANTGQAPLDLSAVSHAGDAHWRVALAAAPLVLGAGETVALPVEVTIAPQASDEGPVPVEIAVRDAAGGMVAAAATIEPVTGATPVAPARAWPVPEQLLGGINVAWSALGGASLDDWPAINDGFATENGTASFANYQLATLEPTIDLAGDAPVDLLGVVLHPGAQAMEDRLRDFTLLASIDGETYAPVLSATLSPLPEAQAFVFPAPVPARFLRLASIGNQGGGSYVTVAELAAIAGPDAIPADQRTDGGVDIARAGLGGHVVWRSLPPDDVDAAASADAAPPAAEWVAGFAAGRAALVTGLRWQEAAEGAPERRATSVAIAASLGSATGPWQEVGRWSLDASGDPQPIALPAPVWARYLRFTATGAADPARVAMPEHVAVIEAAPDGRYRSIVGAWGEGPDAVYELIGEADSTATPAADPVPGGPRSLRLGETAAGVVQRPRGGNSWLLEVPEGVGRLSLVVGEPAGERVGVALRDPAGEPVALERQDATGGETRYLATVGPGVHTLDIQQAPASLAVLWDTSGSVAQMQPLMRAALAGLVGRVDLEETAINLYPFTSEPGGLLADYTADRRMLSQALASYPWADSNSDTEAALLAATEDLFRRDGRRAVVMFTDGESDLSPVNASLWQTLGRARPTVVGVLMPSIVSGEDQWRPLGLVRDWALVGDGFDVSVGYALPPYERAWRRLAAALHRPAAYTLTAAAAVADTPAEPAIGFLSVEAAPAGPAPAAGHGIVEVLLDVSGSMLQRMEDGRRITVAQATLGRLVREMLPPGTPFALRVFGQGARGSCDSALAVPPGPLDPPAAEAAIAAVQPVDGARTPIAEALRLAAEDLAGHPPPRLVVLVTDGEETCGGDPAAELARLNAAGFAARVNILGFAVDDAALADTFRAWAAGAGGVYLEADDAASLDAAMTEATRAAWPVSDAGGTVVASVTAGGPPLELPAGDYTIDFGAGPVPVRIVAGETAVLTAP